MPAITQTVFIALTFLVLAASSRADEYPYDAYVAVAEADVVAGPGHRFYVTDRLPFGTKVEIYREEPSGWLAIRPPAGSFSWAPGDFIERLEDDMGRVTEATGAWIGTSVEHVSQHQQQITLKGGELVQILGEKTVATASGEDRTWLKISPPAGEYRWIYLRDVSRQLPQTRPAPRLAATEDVDEPAAEPEEPRRLELPGSAIALSSLDSPQPRRAGGVFQAQFQSRASQPAGSISPDGFVPRKRRDQAGERISSVPATAPAPVAARAPLARPAPLRPQPAAPASASGLSAAEVNQQLDQIEVDLSLMIAQDRSQWNFEAVKRRVQSLVEGGGDPASRGRARIMLDKINQFEATFPSAAAPAPAALPVAPANKTLADPRYDAQGVLKEVISRKSAKPAAPYAVVDAEGTPLCFVSPSPGLNLNRYLNKPVGLYGRRGYLEELKKPHLLAENVIELDTRLR